MKKAAWLKKNSVSLFFQNYFLFFVALFLALSSYTFLDAIEEIQEREESLKTEERGALNSIGTASFIIDRFPQETNERFFTGLVSLQISPSWNIVLKNIESLGKSPSLSWNLPPSISLLSLEGPISIESLENTLSQSTYKEQICWIATFEKLGEERGVQEYKDIKGSISWIASSESTSIPQKTDFHLNLEERTSLQQNNSQSPLSIIERTPILEKIEEENGVQKEPISLKEFGIILFYSFIGGLFLNIMPTILPVIGMKIARLISLNKEQKKITSPYIDKEGGSSALFFTFGVVIVFWISALLLYGSPSYFGRVVGWGFQLQEPYFIVSLILLIFALSLHLFGIYELFSPSFLHEEDLAGYIQKERGKEAEESIKTAKVTPVVSISIKKKERVFSFWSGFCTACMALPFTSPIVGSVMAPAIVINPLQGLFLLTSLGLGLSFPYVLFARFPIVLSLLPENGPWVDFIKKIFGFVLLGSLVWLGWVLQSQISFLSLPLFLTMLISMAAALSMKSLWENRKTRKGQSIFTSCIGLFFLAVSLVCGCMLIPSEGQTRAYTEGNRDFGAISAPFSKERLRKELSSGRAVVVHVTTKSCLLCQINRVAFVSKEMQKRFQERNISLLVADWTVPNEEIALFLQEYKKNSAPTTLYFSSQDSPPKVLPTIVTPSTLIKAVQNREIADETSKNIEEVLPL